MSVGENIKQKREAAGLSQKELGKNVGTDGKTIGRWEADQNVPGGDAVIRLAQFFSCSTDEILLEAKDRDVGPEMKALFRRFSELPDSLKPMARGMIGGILTTLEEEAARKTAA